MGERCLRHIAERSEREKHRHKENRLCRRHVVAEIDDWSVVLLAGTEALYDHAKPELLGSRDGREARPSPFLRSEESKRLGHRAVGKYLRDAKSISEGIPSGRTNTLRTAPLGRSGIRSRRAELGVKLLNFRLLHFRCCARLRARHARARRLRAGPSVRP